MKDVLRQEIERVVEEHCVAPVARAFLLQLLGAPGFALHPEAPCRAGLLTLEVYQAITGGLSEAALRGAAAVELQMEAAYLFDDVADQELDPEIGLTPPEALALAIAMLSCGAAAACEAVQTRRGSASLQPLLTFHRNYISACGGQFLDSHLERSRGVTTEDALEMTSLKAGGLGRFAAESGASLATNDSGIIIQAAEFGFNLFTYAQIVDDLRDACPSDVLSGDAVRGKKTLPVVFFQQSGGQIPRQRLPDYEGTPVSNQLLHAFSREFHGSGAPVFSAIIGEAFLNRARDNLAELGRLGAEVTALEQFLSANSDITDTLVAAR